MGHQVSHPNEKGISQQIPEICAVVFFSVAFFILVLYVLSGKERRTRFRERVNMCLFSLPNVISAPFIIPLRCTFDTHLFQQQHAAAQATAHLPPLATIDGDALEGQRHEAPVRLQTLSSQERKRRSRKKVNVCPLPFYSELFSNASD